MSDSRAATTNVNTPTAVLRAPVQPWETAAYVLLALIALSNTIGRIGNVTSRDGKLPFLSANDRSRWCTVRALVEHGTYAIDEVIEKDRHWNTIDKVRHKDRAGELRYYSSKPTLFPTMLAGAYWVWYQITGWKISEHPFFVGRLFLMLTNGLCLVAMFWVLAQWVRRWGQTVWGRLFVMATGTMGTFLTTFAITINNHLIAAASLMLTLYFVLQIYLSRSANNSESNASAETNGKPSTFAGWHWFVLAGLFAAFTCANELPALSFTVLLSAWMLWKFPKPTLAAYLPALLLVAAASVTTNYIAHNTWKPAYAFKGDVKNGEENWYSYEKSYWDNPQGIDRGEAERGRYALHSIVGHHGVLSLSPVWFIAIVGIGYTLAVARKPGDGTIYTEGFPLSTSELRRHLLQLALMTCLLTVVVFAFYIMREQRDRNYGGMTSGLRWTFWLIPLWLTMLIPGADCVARWRIVRMVAYALLAISVVSAAYSSMNPWVQPWIMQWGLHAEVFELPQN